MSYRKVTDIKVHVQSISRRMKQVKRTSGPKKGGARLQIFGGHEVKNACAAEIFTKTSVKSIVFEVQKSYRHKFPGE